MIQRVQSLLLLGAALLSLLLIYLPVYERIPVTGMAEAGTPVTLSTSAILLMLNGAIGVLCLIAIFLFKRRNIQIRMCNLVILLVCVLIALLFFMADTMSADQQRIHYLYGSYLPLIQVLLVYIAMRLIKKDEELVRSADRLR